MSDPHTYNAFREECKSNEAIKEENKILRSLLQEILECDLDQEAQINSPRVKEAYTILNKKTDR